MKVKTGIKLAAVATASIATAGALNTPATAESDSSAPLVAAVRQYYHFLDMRWEKKNAPAPPGLPLTENGRTEFLRKAGVIDDTRTSIARHGSSIAGYDDSITLNGAPDFSADRKHATAEFTISRTTELANAKFDAPRPYVLTDTYVVTYVRSKAGGHGLGRWMIDAMTVPAPPPDDAGAQVPPDPATGQPPADPQMPDTFPAVAKQGVTVRREGRMLRAEATPALDGLNYQAMADYAKKWSGKDANGNDLYNDDEYPRQGNNCMNFVSQSLFAGNWPEVEANVFQVEDDSKWDGHVDPWISDLYRTTITWRATSHWMTFATNTGRVRWMPRLWDAALGDVIQTDWDPNNIPDGTVDHAMIVTDWDDVNGPYISQNSPHRQNIPLWLSMQHAQEEGKNQIVWYLART